MPCVGDTADAASAHKQLSTSAASTRAPMLLLPGECWAHLAVYLDLRSLTVLGATSHAVGAALKLAPLDCWVDLRCSSKVHRQVSPGCLRALRRMAGARLRSVDLHGCTQLSCPNLATSLLELHETDKGTVQGLSYLGLGDIRFLNPRGASPISSHGMGRFLQLLMQRCANLTRLDLSGCRAVDGQAIETLAACMDDGILHLRWLALDGCASSLAPVRRAKAENHHPLAPLARHAHKLYELGLGAFLHFDDAALDAALLHPSASNMLRLRTGHPGEAVPAATATTVEGARPVAGVVEAQAVAAARTTSRPSILRVLRLHSSGNLRMTRSQWSRHCLWLPHLVELDLSICPRLGHEVFGSLLQGVPALRRLNVSGCDTLGDAQVLSLFASEDAKKCAAGLIDLNLGKQCLCC